MANAAATAQKTQLEIDRAAYAIRLVRDITVPPEVIFAAWTQPDQVAAWWDPSGQRLSECTIDLRPGGAFSFVSASHPEAPFSGVYRQIAPPNTLVFEANGANGRVRLEAWDGGTRMTVEIVCSSPEHLDRFLKLGIDQGTAQTLDNLGEYIQHRV